MTASDNSSLVSRIAAADADIAISTVVLAFAMDPAARWSWPRPEDFLRNMPLLARAFGGKSFGLGCAHQTGNFAGVALWLPPGVASDEEALGSLIERTAAPAILPDAARVFEKMAGFHPAEPHWYLPLIGVDPARQGQGIGDRLMAHALARCDADNFSAYLESSNPRNLGFYQRHGFEALGAIQEGSSPTIVPMLRKPH
ncbi:GNAT family N-acetyltransferase [Variovorax paradoxus]|nr:GNAT family N-acetyltransferase [Variovorax paradoxus]